MSTHARLRGTSARGLARAGASGRPAGPRPCPGDAGFTMIELVVSVGLMIVLLGVLAFVFQQSARAVASSTDAVSTVQRARSFEARFGQDISRAVRSVLETESDTVRTFLLSPRYEQDAAGNPATNIGPDGGDEVMFVSKTRHKGVEAMWVVRYYYEPIRPGADHGSIKRMVRVDHSIVEEVAPLGVDDPSVWDISASETYDPESDPDMETEVVSFPVQPITGLPVFYAIDPDVNLVRAGLAFRLPASVKVSLNFLDSRGGRSFMLPMQFHFPIYQGE